MSRPGASGAGRRSRRRPLLLLALCPALLVACGGGTSQASASGGSTAGDRRSVPTAGSEAAGAGDWTATVSPLGRADQPPPRVLASDLPDSGDTGAASVHTAQASGGRSSAANPAVVSLLNAADAHARAGDYARAAATLERAISIDPNNAWLWHRLADTRLRQGLAEQAAGLAAKSNALTATDRALQADNWRLIAGARRRMGDSQGAAAAEAEAARLGN